jgi:hypothetical protein
MHTTPEMLIFIDRITYLTEILLSLHPPLSSCCLQKQNGRSNGFQSSFFYSPVFVLSLEAQSIMHGVEGVKLVFS